MIICHAPQLTEKAKVVSRLPVLIDPNLLPASWKVEIVFTL
jgi:hypothetical protein